MTIAFSFIPPPPFSDSVYFVYTCSVGQDSTKPTTPTISMDPRLVLGLEIGVPIVASAVGAVLGWLFCKQRCYKLCCYKLLPSTDDDKNESNNEAKVKIDGKGKNNTNHNENSGNITHTHNTTTINNYHGTAPAGSSDPEGSSPLLTPKK